MSELDPKSATEHNHQHETLTEPQQKAEKHHVNETTKEALESPDNLGDVIDSLKNRAKQEAVNTKDVAVEQDTSNGQLPVITRQIKTDVFKRIVRSTQTRLRGPNKALSKVIHNQAVDTISTVGAKTIGRPWGLLVGGVSALIGSGAILYMAKHYGFRYNLLLVFLLFIGGFVVGTAIEFVLLALRRKQKR